MSNVDIIIGIQYKFTSIWTPAIYVDAGNIVSHQSIQANLNTYTRRLTGCSKTDKRSYHQRIGSIEYGTSMESIHVAKRGERNFKFYQLVIWNDAIQCFYFI